MSDATNAPINDTLPGDHWEWSWWKCPDCQAPFPIWMRLVFEDMPDGTQQANLARPIHFCQPCLKKRIRQQDPDFGTISTSLPE
jgi:hypothetical protein